MEWKRIQRPGYFGRNRDKILAGYTEKYGAGNWRIVWACENCPDMEFNDVCVHHYEASYMHYFASHIDELAYISESYSECIDNAMTNIESGLDYMRQEAYSTHIQDIAVRNCISYYGFQFQGPKDSILVIRSADSSGYKWGPGNIPYMNPVYI